MTEPATVEFIDGIFSATKAVVNHSFAFYTSGVTIVNSATGPTLTHLP